jgi:Integrase zinc binding domain/RNase H-like domain found in reverse transcriptase
LKLECRGLLKSLKKLRFWLFGRYFTVLTDSQTLVWLLNQPPNDLPNAMMTRWLAYIRLFDFDTKHVQGNKNGAADALSRRGYCEEDGDLSDDDEAVDNFFEAKLYSVMVEPVKEFFETDVEILRIHLNEEEYEGNDLMLGKFLSTLQRPDGLTDLEYQQLRKKSKLFFVRDGYLYKKGKRAAVPRRVVGLQDQKLEIMREIHDEIGHRGRGATFDQVRRRYQWKGMFADVDEWVRSCEECQRRAQIRYEESLHPTWSVSVWDKIGVDIVYMPRSNEGSYLVLARDDLSGWVEGRAIDAANSFNVSKFLYEEVVCRHGCPRRIVLDGGRENMDMTRNLLEDYRIQNTVISSFHPQTAGLVERGHGPIINSLAKYCQHAPETWPKHLSLALWADRISVRRSTGYSAFELLYGRECLLPVELMIESWQTVDWEAIENREDLILARMQQLDHRRVSETIAAMNLRNSRKGNKIYFDQHKRLRPVSQRLQEGDLVLLYDSALQKTRHTKLRDKWRGPYKIIEKAENSTFYRLAELDGTPLAGTTAGNRLKKFYSREIADMLRDQAQPSGHQNEQNERETSRNDTEAQGLDQDSEGGVENDEDDEEGENSMDDDGESVEVSRQACQERGVIRDG